MRQGVHPETPPTPFTPGWDLVGVTDKLGAGVSSPEPGQTVFNYVAAYQMMHRTVRVKPGQRVLIHGAAGGIGTALLQLGRLVGLEMYGTASLPAHEMVRTLGGNRHGFTRTSLPF